MKAMLYLKNNEEPVAVLDDVKVVEFNDNHQSSPIRVFYTSSKLNSGRSMTEMHRDERLTLKLDDGRSANVVFQHSSMDSVGNMVGVLRVLGAVNG